MFFDPGQPFSENIVQTSPGIYRLHTAIHHWGKLILRMKWVLPITFLFFLAASCNRHDVKLARLDLSSYGVDLVIMAPDSADIDVREYESIKDITIKGGPYFDIQIFESEATSPDVAALKSEELQALWQEAYFRELTWEDPSGFIFKTRIDSVSNGYDFRHFKIIGNREYRFQAGLTGSFILEDVERMYQAVK